MHGLLFMSIKNIVEVYCVLATIGFRHLVMHEDGTITIEFHSAGDAMSAAEMLNENTKVAGFLLTLRVQDIKT